MWSRRPCQLRKTRSHKSQKYIRSMGRPSGPSEWAESRCARWRRIDGCHVLQMSHLMKICKENILREIRSRWFVRRNHKQLLYMHLWLTNKEIVCIKVKKPQLVFYNTFIQEKDFARTCTCTCTWPQPFIEQNLTTIKKLNWYPQTRSESFKSCVTKNNSLEILKIA